MFHQLIIFTTFLFFFDKKLHNNNFFFQMPSFDKYCGYKPTIDKLMEITNNMKLCIDGYYPHSIIVTKINNKNNESQNHCKFDVICSKKINHTPELILRL